MRCYSPAPPHAAAARGSAAACAAAPRRRVRASASAAVDVDEAPPAARETCRRCGRAICLCAHLPADGGLDTRTAIVVVQSRHEFFNANSTGRLAQLGLRNCALVWDADNDEVVDRPPLPPAAGVLFPGAGATMLGPGIAPPALVVIDGTWAQAKRMLKKNRWLQELPRYEFPTRADQPSTYRFRKQPQAHFLSTVECIARVLQAVEPGPGDAAAERLIGAFDALVESQLPFSEQRGGGRTHRFHSRRKRTTPAEALARRGISEPPRVVAYGEYLHGRLIEWAALRPASGEVFHAFVASSESDLKTQDALQPAGFDAAWRAWLRPGELPAVWTLREDAARHALGASAAAVGVQAAKAGGGMPPPAECHALPLKEAYAALLAARVGGRRFDGPGALEDAVRAEAGAAQASQQAASVLDGRMPTGRAAQRLAHTAGMAAALAAAAVAPL